MICGLSKLITATAVMLAVQDGLVKLDEPITTYLPDFKVNSRYEEHPEQKITLRRLLNCTAGIPVEAPLGNYFEPASTASFEDHVQSLYGSWLVCPVGSSFFLSNASSDLAAYTVRVAAGKPFKDYLKERLFTPLGMSNTTADRQEILDNSERAIGHMMGDVEGARGVSGPRSGRHLQHGRRHGPPRAIAHQPGDARRPQCRRAVLDGDHPCTRGDRQHRPERVLWPGNLYRQAVAREDRDAALARRWGFGFLSLLHWYPEYGVGMVVLTNKLPNSALSDLGLTLTDKLVKGKIIEKRFPQARAGLQRLRRHLVGLGRAPADP